MRLQDPPKEVSRPIRVGILANPASGRDIRRVISKASVFPTAEKCNMIQRLLGALTVCGVDEAWMMPDKGGIATVIKRFGKTPEGKRLLPVQFTDTAIMEIPEDTRLSVRAMVAAGIRAIIVLGGDGTHRLVAEECGDIPMATLSTGTNNSFPELREATLSGLAAGLVATERLNSDDVTRREKRLLVEVNGETRGMALVDACISADMFVAAKAVWQVEQLRELYVTFASSEAIGLSSIASLVHPVGRDQDHGLGVQMDPVATQKVMAPIAPGLFAQLGIQRWDELQLGSSWAPSIDRGVIALDGEREIEFRAVDKVRLSLDRLGPRVIDVSKALGAAAKNGIMLSDSNE
ncbi:MAG TPA: acetoin catabolism protein [Deltaproteobacteria bacterium]|nr:MAG: acetoin catabolism protein [Pseudomonadota bacterium]HBM53694.1 acetoin catabolism protein [Deltaproteobacteria bacterium]